MGKRTVITKHGDDIPFLRGILVKSLVKAGLEFDEAYHLAQTVRDKLDDEFEIQHTELAAITGKLIEKLHGRERRQAYDECPHAMADSIVVHTSTKDLPFSSAILAYDLESYGIDTETAVDVAQLIHRQLSADDITEIDAATLTNMIYTCLRDEFGQNEADVFVAWRAFEASEKTLLLLIGGVTGVGKSTVSHEICYKLDIPQIQSTDMIREIIRAYLAPPFVPLLQHSSFEAWRAIPEISSKRSIFKKGPPVIEGFLSQLGVLQPAVQSSINRALLEHNHMVIEGVHVLPTEIELTTARNNAVVVPVMLANTSKTSLKKQLITRGKEATNRPASRYIENFDYIWALQSYLLKTADNAEISIFTNTDIKDTVNAIIKLISDTIRDHFPPERYRHLCDKNLDQSTET